MSGVRTGQEVALPQTATAGLPGLCVYMLPENSQRVLSP